MLYKNPDNPYLATSDLVTFSWNPPKNKWQVEIVPSFVVRFAKDVNFVHRFFTKLLLGWKWSRLDEK